MGLGGGSLSPVDFASMRALIGALVQLVADGFVSGVHDVSDGGLAVCLAEMAVRSQVGMRVGVIEDTAELFTETPGRVVVCTTSPDEILKRAASAGVPATLIGMAGGDRIVVEGLVDLALADVSEVWSGALPKALGETFGATA
jgi:phosphoribosylformylglycinamidine (FGAM) synthase-like enzyme